MTTLAFRPTHVPMRLAALVAGGLWLAAWLVNAMSTLGLVIDGVVVVAGRVPTHEQVAGWLRGTT